MATLYTEQSNNVRKTWILMSIFFVLIIAIGWFISWYYGSPGILYVAVVISIFMNVWSYWYSDKLVLALTKAKSVTREEQPEFWNITENLSIAEGMPMPKLYVIDDASPNAFATGRDSRHAAIAVTSGLLVMLDRSELEGVIAHELSHIGNRDILLQTVVVVLVGLITLVSDFFLRMSFHKGRDRGDGKAQMIIMIIGLVFMILSPIIATIIKLAISRKREFLADATGALMTRYPDGLASALRKISSSGQPLKNANHATAHLFIVSPFAVSAVAPLRPTEAFSVGGAKVERENGRKVSFMTKLFMTHPPVEERINALLGKRTDGINKAI